MENCQSLFKETLTKKFATKKCLPVLETGSTIFCVPCYYEKKTEILKQVQDDNRFVQKDSLLNLKNFSETIFPKRFIFC